MRLSMPWETLFPGFEIVETYKPLFGGNFIEEGFGRIVCGDSRWRNKPCTSFWIEQTHKGFSEYRA